MNATFSTPLPGREWLGAPVQITGLQSPESNWTNNSETVLEKDRGQTRRPCEPPRFGDPVAHRA